MSRKWRKCCESLICIRGSTDDWHLQLCQGNGENAVSPSNCQDPAGNIIVQKPKVGWKVPGRLNLTAGLGVDGQFWPLSLLAFTRFFAKF